jgi:uncharacterized membrane protein
MFVRSELKQQAKDLMKDHFPQMFLVTLIAGLFTGDLINVDFNFDSQMIQINFAQYYSFTLTVLSIGLLILAFAASIAVSAFLIKPLCNGLRRYFRNMTSKSGRVEDLLGAFSNNYMHNVKVLFIRDLNIAIYTLLLVIPGVIKMYEYAFVDYILKDQPDIDPNEALALSSRMTDGLKWEMFVLDWSFILWMLLAAALSVFTLGLSGIVLNVYTNQTHAQLYQWVLDHKEYQEAI